MSLCSHLLARHLVTRFKFSQKQMRSPLNLTTSLIENKCVYMRMYVMTYREVNIYNIYISIASPLIACLLACAWFCWLDAALTHLLLANHLLMLMLLYLFLLFILLVLLSLVAGIKHSFFRCIFCMEFNIELNALKIIYTYIFFE